LRRPEAYKYICNNIWFKVVINKITRIAGFSFDPASIPAALPLFAAGLGDIGLMARPKKRKAVVAA
jgi:hypothetical protein